MYLYWQSVSFLTLGNDNEDSMEFCQTFSGYSHTYLKQCYIQYYILRLYQCRTLIGEFSGVARALFFKGTGELLTGSTQRKQ